MNIKSKALLAYVVVFLLGGASGFFLNEAIGPPFSGKSFDRGPEFNSGFPFKRNGDISPRMKNFMIERLELRGDQVEPFFEVQSEHLQNLYRSMKAQRNNEIEMLRELYSNFIDDAEEILTEKQIQELNSFAHPDSVHQRRIKRLERHRSFR